MTADRDDFTVNVKRILAQRAGYLCSKPDCRKLTIKPHSDPEKSLSNGVAAHINAASENGPRYDPNQTPEERSSINNGIWLCCDHSVIIDKDTSTYPANFLREWKSKHEEFISNGGGLLKLPDINIETTNGLSILPNSPFKITGDDVSKLREHILTIKNINSKELLYLHSRIQLPEYVVSAEVMDSPIGTNVKCIPERSNLVVNASGSGSVEMVGKPRPPMNLELEIDKLPPLKEFRLKFITIPHSAPDGYILGFDENSSMHYIHGELQHEYYGEYIKRIFVTKFKYDQDSRKLESSQCEEYTEDSKLALRYLGF